MKPNRLWALLSILTLVAPAGGHVAHHAFDDAAAAGHSCELTTPGCEHGDSPAEAPHDCNNCSFCEGAERPMAPAGAGVAQVLAGVAILADACRAPVSAVRRIGPPGRPPPAPPQALHAIVLPLLN